MNAFTQGNIACAERNIARALTLLEKHTAESLPDPRLVAAAYAELLDCKGRLAAAAQLEELQREIESVDTQRSPHLAVVK